MANVTLGKKRAADGDPDGAQPLTKRFGCLQIGTPIQGFGARAIHEHHEDPRLPTLPADAMMLDDTDDITYIHNLDQELADPEPAKDHLVLHPVAARLMSVPKAVLSNPAHGKELVLYTEPTSLTVPREQDSVRRAIIESRARARAKRAQSSSSSSPISPPLSQVSSSVKKEMNVEVYDDDPMDIDLDL